MRTDPVSGRGVIPGPAALQPQAPQVQVAATYGRSLDHRRIEEANLPLGGADVERALRRHAQIVAEDVAPFGLGLPQRCAATQSGADERGQMDSRLPADTRPSSCSTVGSIPRRNWMQGDVNRTCPPPATARTEKREGRRRTECVRHHSAAREVGSGG